MGRLDAKIAIITARHTASAMRRRAKAAQNADTLGNRKPAG